MVSGGLPDHLAQNGVARPLLLTRQRTADRLRGTAGISGDVLLSRHIRAALLFGNERRLVDDRLRLLVNGLGRGLLG